MLHHHSRAPNWAPLHPSVAWTLQGLPFITASSQEEHTPRQAIPLVAIALPDM